MGTLDPNPVPFGDFRLDPDPYKMNVIRNTGLNKFENFKLQIFLEPDAIKSFLCLMLLLCRIEHVLLAIDSCHP
jgi:hypothetical protein